ncbi:hypothetical protein DL95DRAFT_283528, partial [Leptodontidium sp. 2 PMI_412]
IILGDIQDWEKETPRMATIYLNSHLDIAATSSFNALGGRAVPRKLPSLHPLLGQDRHCETRRFLLNNQGSDCSQVSVRPLFHPTHA